jgi:hypothetical protein
LFQFLFVCILVLLWAWGIITPQVLQHISMLMKEDMEVAASELGALAASNGNRQYLVL